MSDLQRAAIDDLVVIATHVWMGNLAPPARATIAVRQREIDPPRHAQPLRRFVARLAA